MRTWVVVGLVSVLFGACGMSGKVKKLAAPERAHYEAVKVFMDQDQEKTWLKLKTTQEREAWLREHVAAGQRVGPEITLWDVYHQYDAERRDAIAQGGVKIGWTEDQVLMAWGEPHASRRTAKRTAERSEIWVYRFEVTPKQEVLVWTPKSKTTFRAIDTFQIDVHIDDMVVVDNVRKEQWDQ